MKKNDGKHDDLEQVIAEMSAELDRSMGSLRMPYYKDLVPSYISYCYTTNDETCVRGDLGSANMMKRKHTLLETEVRAHRGDSDMTGCGVNFTGFYRDPSEGAVRIMLWRLTDEAFKDAAKDYLTRQKVKLAVPGSKGKRHRRFHHRKGIIYDEDAFRESIDVGQWKEIVEECTAILSGGRDVTSSSMEMNMSRVRQCFINSEGSRVVKVSESYSILLSADSLSRNRNRKMSGDPVGVSRVVQFSDPSEMPSKEEIIGYAKEVLTELDALISAPVQEPLVRPAVLDSEISAQLMYAILGNSVLNRCAHIPGTGENLRVKGDRFFPSFISVYDDPSEEYFVSASGRRTRLNGHAYIDDQGMPCRKVSIIEKGVLKDYPCTRDYLDGAEQPNGHGRISSSEVVPCITNLFIRSSDESSVDELKKRVIDECVEKGYDYGFLIEGATSCEMDSEENFYKLTPSRVYRIWAKDAEDRSSGKRFSKGDLQLVRNVELVGNPDITLSSIKATGDDYSVTVPSEVDEIDSFHQSDDSAIVCPSMYLSKVELKKEFYSKSRPPLIPHPMHDRDSKDE